MHRYDQKTRLNNVCFLPGTASVFISIHVLASSATQRKNLHFIFVQPNESGGLGVRLYNPITKSTSDYLNLHSIKSRSNILESR